MTETFEGSVVSIYIAPEAGAPMRSVDEVRAIPGRGLEGDRYFDGDGTFSRRNGPDREITLVESEAIEALSKDYEVAISLGDSRRNVVTRGVALNHLVGVEFVVGDVALRGLRLCEPCGHLESLTEQGVKPGLVHRGGLRAQILSEGLLRPGDVVRPRSV